jgi:hypothetical protein
LQVAPPSKVCRLNTYTPAAECVWCCCADQECGMEGCLHHCMQQMLMSWFFLVLTHMHGSNEASGFLVHSEGCMHRGVAGCRCHVCMVSVLHKLHSQRL